LALLPLSRLLGEQRFSVRIGARRANEDPMNGLGPDMMPRVMPAQAQIGQQLGISQMHVSRLLAHALGYLRPRLLGLPERASGAGLAAAPGMDLTGAAAHRRRAPAASPARLPAAARAGGRPAGGTC
jgi:hypothetical protein